MKKPFDTTHLEKEALELQRKCVAEAWDEKKDDWNKKHFPYCERDLKEAIFKERQRLKKLVEEMLRKRIKSCYKDLLNSKNNTRMLEHAEAYRNRLDELLLFYCSCFEISFVDACKKLGVDYEDMDYRELKNRC